MGLNTIGTTLRVPCTSLLRRDTSGCKELERVPGKSLSQSDTSDWRALRQNDVFQGRPFRKVTHRIAEHYDKTMCFRDVPFAKWHIGLQSTMIKRCVPGTFLSQSDRISHKYGKTVCSRDVPVVKWYIGWHITMIKLRVPGTSPPQNYIGLHIIMI